MIMTTRHKVLGLGLAIVAGLCVFAPSPETSSSAGSESGLVSPVNPVSGKVSETGTPEKEPEHSKDLVVIQAVLPRDGLVGSADADTDLFDSRKWAQAPEPAAQSATFVSLLPAIKPVPQAPAVPFVYQGKVRGEQGWDVFLLKGDAVFVVHEKMMFDSVYQVESIRAPYMVVMYLPLKLTQQIDIGGAE